MIEKGIWFVKRCVGRLNPIKQRTSRAPSMLKALGDLVPRRVFREVIASCGDRRQWGVVAAAWVGVSEREFTKAAAEEMGLEYVERVPVPDLSVLGSTAREVCELLRKVGVVPLLEGARAHGFIAVDPAEVRGLHLYDGSQVISLGSWGEISRSLDAAEHALIQSEASRKHEERRDRSELCARLVEALIAEASAHHAESLEIEATSEKARYSFVTPEGKRGVGVIRRDIVNTILEYLGQFLASGYISHSYGHVVVRKVSGAVPSDAGPIRLSWIVQKGVRELQPPILIEEPTEPVACLQRASTLRSSLPGEVTILVVDDNPMFCRVLERLLQRDGYHPIFACNGSEAWERLSDPTGLRPSAIVCDLHMPIMNGEELLKRIRASDDLTGVPVIMLTSDDDVNAEVTLLAQGADAFVSKVRDPRVLCAQIRRLIGKRTAQEAA